ncbi:Hypothetical protein POVN_LOCUS172 [uncultured virus]|nr:Hypothetical protein POVN_LOCUS172 [uncultured virus]
MHRNQKSESPKHQPKSQSKAHSKPEPKPEVKKDLSLPKFEDPILYIWKNIIRPGDKITTALSTENFFFTEGTVKQINLKKGFVEIVNAGGPALIPLLDTLYVQLLCESGKCSSSKGKCKKNADWSCIDSSRVNVWEEIEIGESVAVNVGGPFVAFVEEINLEKRFVGLRSESGITYIPMQNIPFVRIYDPPHQLKDKSCERSENDKPHKDNKNSKLHKRDESDQEDEEESERED